MKRGWMIVLLLSLGLNVGLGANYLRHRQPPPPPPEAPGPDDDTERPAASREQVEQYMRHRLDRMAQELDLSDEQQGRLWNLHETVGREVFSRRAAMFEARGRLREVYRQDPLDRDLLRTMQRKMSALQADLDSVVVEILFEERSILTPEQRQNYGGMFPFGADRAPRWGSGQGRGDGSHHPRRDRP